jgi:hypothetical protein
LAQLSVIGGEDQGGKEQGARSRERNPEVGGQRSEIGEHGAGSKEQGMGESVSCLFNIEQQFEPTVFPETKGGKPTPI